MMYRVGFQFLVEDGWAISGFFENKEDAEKVCMDLYIEWRDHDQSGMNENAIPMDQYTFFLFKEEDAFKAKYTFHRLAV